MKLKITFTVVLFCICLLSFGQDYKSSTKSVKDIDSQIEHGQYTADATISADKLIIKIIDQDTIVSYNDTEWDKIKEEIQLNKERFIKTNETYISRVIDTIFINGSTFTNKSQLSGW
ncbi:hypothetical protein [Aquimarina sp. RZ0]|uniref:hypothetical protein n=1 Tax=Aquimarina sp. RZ0 TaxID=2607730 RepID=UPI0011F16C36|nr:hypothetical protein [Aquimarina sp. RZ0]KAA1244582.1 hypothetical protein F0000_15780 [Aquimarina sp. RZ0]